MNSPFQITSAFDADVGTNDYFLGIDAGNQFFSVHGQDPTASFTSIKTFDLKSSATFDATGLVGQGTIIGIYNRPANAGLWYLVNGNSGIQVVDGTNTAVRTLTASNTVTTNDRFQAGRKVSSFVSFVATNGRLLDFVDPLVSLGGGLSAVNPTFFDINNGTYVKAPSATLYDVNGGNRNNISGTILADGNTAVWSISSTNRPQYLHYVKYNNGTPIDTVISQVDGSPIWNLMFGAEQPAATAGFIFANYYSTSADNVMKIAKIDTTTLIATTVTVLSGSTPVTDIQFDRSNTDGTKIVYFNNNSGNPFYADLTNHIVTAAGDYIHGLDPTVPAANVDQLVMCGDWVIYDSFDNDTQVEFIGGINIAGGGSWTIGGRPALEYLRLRDLGYF